MKFLVFVVLVITCCAINAQSNYSELNFQPYYGAHKFFLKDSSQIIDEKSDLQIDALKCYISNIQFVNNGKVVYEEKNSFHLLDASVEKTMSLKLNKNDNVSFDAIRFNLGIDSITNTAGALGGDLDPTKGMYWAWQSGYINFKMEGKSALCNTRNHEFHFHLGGYQNPYNNIQTIVLKVKETSIINIKIDVEYFFNQIDLSQCHTVMSPSEKAVWLSKLLSDSFSINN